MCKFLELFTIFLLIVFILFLGVKFVNEIGNGYYKNCLNHKIQPSVCNLIFEKE